MFVYISQLTTSVLEASDYFSFVSINGLSSDSIASAEWSLFICGIPVELWPLDSRLTYALEVSRVTEYFQSSCVRAFCGVVRTQTCVSDLCCDEF